MNRFEDKYIFVTGAGQGIGYDICRRFAMEGAIVGLNDVDAGLAEAASDTINKEVGEERVFPYAADVADVAVIQETIDRFSQTHGGLHVMVANAGMTNFEAFLEDTVGGFDRLMSTNMRGTYFSVQAAAKQMIAHQIPGRILLMSSVVGQQAHLKLSAYSMTKAAIRMLAKSLAVELGPYGITVNALAPGAIMTERTRSIDPKFGEGWRAVTPSQTVGQVADISASALFLASDEARHISGEVLIIDGGWTAYSPMPDEGSGA